MLFDLCSTGFINSDDKTVMTIKDKNKTCTFKTFGIKNSADIRADEKTLKTDPSFIDFTAIQCLVRFLRDLQYALDRT